MLKALRDSPVGFLLAGLALVALFAVQQIGLFGSGDLFSRTLSNALHIPLFAMAALLVARLLGWPNPLWVLVVCVGLGVGSEALQIGTARSASLLDLTLDVGAAALVTAALLRDRRLSRDGAHGARRILWVAVAAAVLLATVAAPARVLAAYVSRDRAFPTLFSPSSLLQRPLWRSNSETRLVGAATASASFSEPRVLEIVWAEAAFPGITLTEVVEDWSGYGTLVVEAYLSEGAALPLTAAIGYEGVRGTAAYHVLHLQPGFHRLEYPLASLLAEGDAPPVRRLILHTAPEQAGRRLYLGTVTLK